MEDRSTFRLLLRGSMVGIHLAASMFVGLALGYFLDKWLGTRPWLMIVCFILGVFAGFREIFRMISREPDPPDENSGSAGGENG